MNIRLELEKYIKENIQVKTKISALSKMKKSIEQDYAMQEKLSIDEYIRKEQDNKKFQTLLFKYIDEKDLKDSDVYTKVNIDRRLFSKIRSSENYHPSKETVILLGLSLELTEKEIVCLLDSAAYGLPKNNTYDLIIRFCFKNNIYNINDVNYLLYSYGYKTLN